MDYEIYYTEFRMITDRITVMQERIIQLQDAATKGYLFNTQIVTQMTAEITKQKKRLILLNSYADLSNSEFKKHWNNDTNSIDYGD